MRLKIIAGNLIAVLVVGLVSYGMIRTKLRQSLSDEVDQQLGNDRLLFERSWRLSNIEFLNEVEDRASSSNVRQVFSGLDEASRRKRAYEATESIEAWFRDPNRGHGGGPDIAIIFDETGRVLSRNKDINRMYGESLTQLVPTVRSVLSDGNPRADVWNKKDEQKVLQIATAPIVNSESGSVIGGLLVGYDISNGVAQREAGVLGRDIAFVIDGSVYSSSMPTEAVGALRIYLFGPGAGHTKAALNPSGTPSPSWTAELGGNDYVGTIAPLPMSHSLKIAYAVLGNRTARMSLADATNILLLLTILGVVFVIIYGSMIGTTFLRPIEEIEEGVLAVINGNTELRLDIESAELGGLAYRINQLLNVLTGVTEEDEEGRVSRPPEGAAWKDAAFADQTGVSRTGTAAAPIASPAGSDVIDDAQLAAQLSSEPAEAYYERIYSEYVSAKQAAGEDVSGVSRDNFIEKLRSNEATLAQRHGCRLVRFQVQSRGNQVILRPVIIR